MCTYLRNLFLSLAFYGKFAIVQRNILRKEKYCFWKKNHFIIFFGLFLPKEPCIKGRNIFKRYINWFYSIHATFSHFGKKIQVFLKQTHLFLQKTYFRTLWEILLLQSHCTTNLLQFGEKKFTIRNVKKNIIFRMDAIGRHRVKKTF